MKHIDMLNMAAAIGGYTISGTTGQDPLNKTRASLRVNTVKADIISRFGGKWNSNYREGWLPLAALYSDGTITATQNSNTVTGASTAWTSTMAGRKMLMPDGAYYKIASVASTTSIILTQPYQGSTLSGQSYSIWKDEYRLYPEVYEIGGFVEYGYPKTMDESWPKNMKQSYPKPVSVDLPDVFTVIGRKPADAYSTGTVSGSINTYTLTGSGTSWLANVEPGFEITIGSYKYNVRSVDSDTQITLYQQLVVAIVAGTTYSAIGVNCLIVRFKQPTSQRIVHYWYWAKDYPFVNDSDQDWISELYPKVILNGIMYYDYMDKNDPIRTDRASMNYESSLKDAKVADDNAMTGVRTIAYDIPPEARD